ncbi:3,4-dihydroxy 2-butanone 4-phosphate synthase [Halarchaeum rubridurum]|uniref:3,4-dihydroxy-2-butanone 4-phosphate synthase n=1 Tax=Halarchaeum rubridurum TaxID=489911 RepID=A0A830FPB7_9EURY|nr:3,4-dihydroxy-2-butanone-4-phosphate synthase [Halarchaeum rubridurum]MBP1954098.1 3,4-dihydroxy 2-butanone 4-phosphate synthase [Halarchaeum rubridurum]GGM57278.1 3,4-dihydroxy-2-butanone-4-phosphate synthase [Halarchaeum rubridurum]
MSHSDGVSDPDAGTEAGATDASADAPTGDVAAAVAAIERGDPVLVHDAADREGEVDLIYHAADVTPAAVARMRTDAGGLICTALSHDVCEAFELPFLADALDHPAVTDDDLGYDERASFSLTVNHRDTYTGITDDDRSLTITALADAAADPAGTEFAATFRAPGHVHLLRGAPDGLADREGHTELGLALADAAGRPPAVVVCEMLDAETGGARTPADARRYAEEHGFVYVEGRDVLDALRR